MTQTGGRRIPIRARIEPGPGKVGNLSPIRARIGKGARAEIRGVLGGVFCRETGGVREVLKMKMVKEKIS